MSNDQFKQTIRALAAKAGDKADAVVRLTVMKLAASVVMRSPVDTGRFRANWQYGAVSMNKATTGDTDTSGSSSLGRVNNGLQSWAPGQTIYLTNSLPYARPLEYGHSKQAPGGMVRLTVVEFRQHLGSAVKAIA